MAFDELLLRRCGVPLLRFYRWARPSISFGYFCRVAEVQHFWENREPVRRWTGGGVVPHGEGEDVTYTLVVPREHPFAQIAPAETYERIHGVVARALGEFVSGVALTPTAPPKVSEHCFENPAAHDILATGQKIAGAAQRRTREGFLHQGSIRFAGAPEALIERIATLFAPNHSRRGALPSEVAAAEELALDKYSTDAWLRRR